MPPRSSSCWPRWRTSSPTARPNGSLTCASAGQQREASRAGTQALWLAAGLGTLAAVVIAVAARPLASLIGAQGPALEHAVTYLRISSLALPAVLLTIACHGILRAELRLGGLLVVVVVANLVNLVVELVFVNVLHLGIAGSAWSTVIAQVGSVLAYLALVRRTVAPALGWPRWSVMRPLLDVGAVLVLRVGALMATFTIATAIAARIDPPTLAAHQIIGSLFILFALCLDALAVPTQTLVAEAIGADDTPLAARVAKRSLRLSIGAGLVLGMALAASAPWVGRLFSNDHAVVSRASGGVLVLAVLLVPGAAAFAVDGILIGAGQFRALSHMMLVVLVVFIGCATVPILVPASGVIGIWGALAVWMLGRAFLGVRWCQRYLWVSPGPSDPIDHFM
ncbi:MAG: MATE family efflux transporter [Ilumatobacteraceae bacterium]